MLTFTIVNTSPFDARITGIGFDLPPLGNASPSGLNGFTGMISSQPAGVTFVGTDIALGNVPGFNEVVLDFGFFTGPAPDFAGGNADQGLPPGGSATFLVFGFGFAGLTEEEICNSIFVRFQRVGEDGEGSDVGTPGAPIPEPTTMLLLGSGLAGLAAGIRRRRKKSLFKI